MLAHSIDHLINGLTPIEEELPPFEMPSYMNQFLSAKDPNYLNKYETVANLSRQASLRVGSVNESSNMDVEMDISTE